MIVAISFKPASPRFPLGRLVATPNALQSLANGDIMDGLGRHLSGDWGDLDPDDKEANDRALVEGTRLFSAYTGKSGVRYWIITEANRSATTVLLPEDY
jgi:hypothetical protein